jgi:hypothetical protein
MEMNDFIHSKRIVLAEFCVLKLEINGVATKLKIKRVGVFLPFWHFNSRQNSEVKDYIG